MSFPFPSSIASNGGETPLKKKASLQLLPETKISSLPDDLILSCLARVSRLYYPTLSLVSGNANVCDGKIYVAGGCQDKNYSSNWMEVYDPKIQTWETLFCPVAERCMSGIKSAVIEGEIFMFGNHKGLSYKPKEDRWTWLGMMTLLDIGWECPSLQWSSFCVIDNILYCFSRMLKRGLMWYDSNIGYWVNVLGLKELPKIPKYSYLRLVCYGRKMAVFWDKNIPSSGGDYKTIWCAVIALEKRNNKEIWGNVESIDEDVLTVPSSYKFVCGLTATL